MIVYFHRNPETKEIFYVGIASENGRCQRPWKKDNRNKYWTHYVAKYGGFEVDIIHKGLSLEEAKLKEIYYISLFGKRINGGQLVNLADGGETNAGYKQTEDQRKISSNRAKRLGTAHMMTPEAREKANVNISKSLKGKLMGSKNPNFGNRWTDEMKKSLSDKKKEHFKNIPSRKKIYIKMDPEIARKNIYTAMVERWGKKVICNKSGIIYKTIVDAASSIGMKKDTLRAKLNGKIPNNTSFRFLQHDSAA